MSTSSINFNDKKIKKSNFYIKNKKIFNIDDIDVNKILVSKKEQYGRYINKFDKNKITMSLMIKDIQLFKKYNKIWKKN